MDAVNAVCLLDVVLLRQLQAGESRIRTLAPWFDTGTSTSVGFATVAAGHTTARAVLRVLKGLGLCLCDGARLL